MEGENYIQCRSVDGGKVSKTSVKNEFRKYGDSKNEGKYRAYTFVTNGEFTDAAKEYLKEKKRQNWAVEWIENADI